MPDNKPTWWNLLDDEATAAAHTVAHVLHTSVRELGPSRARALLNTAPAAEPITALECVEQLSVPTRGGAINARMYRSSASTPTAPGPALLYLHGGGFVLGTLDGADELCRAIAAGSGWTVLSVDYRLAPENPYPAA